MWLFISFFIYVIGILLLSPISLITNLSDLSSALGTDSVLLAITFSVKQYDRRSGRMVLAWSGITEDTYSQISDTLMGHEVSAETRSKISKGNKGKTRTEETRRLMSLVQKGYKATDEARLKMSQAKAIYHGSRKAILAYNNINAEVLVFMSINDAAAHFGINRETLRFYLKTNKLLLNSYELVLLPKL